MEREWQQKEQSYLNQISDNERRYREDKAKM